MADNNSVLDNSFFIDEKESNNTSEELTSNQRTTYFNSENTVNSLVDKLDILQDDFKKIYDELNDGKLNKELSGKRRDELINKLNQNKADIMVATQSTLNDLSKDITKLKSYKVHSNVNVDVFNDLKRNNSDDDDMFVD